MSQMILKKKNFFTYPYVKDKCKKKNIYFTLYFEKIIRNNNNLKKNKIKQKCLKHPFKRKKSFLKKNKKKIKKMLKKNLVFFFFVLQF